ncbi:Homeobox protein Nkx-2.6 [Thelohanellus kitauei]|uniref:Homeobox protein Nkx-2.6 n=1 Tax=Thelohanellus kitauei TaxID=669202 RepID=A0A0C2MRU9_THEKT|nr:Homeobox protein Nkx-2.6 [Thelohanellus kitauei]
MESRDPKTNPQGKDKEISTSFATPFSKYSYIFADALKFYLNRKERRRTLKRQKNSAQACLQSIPCPKLQYDSSYGNYFRLNPTFLTDERWVEFTTFNYQDPRVAVNESFEDYSSDVIVKGGQKSEINMAEPQHSKSDSVLYDTCSNMPTVGVSGSNESLNPSRSDNTDETDECSPDIYKPPKLVFTFEQYSMLDELFKEKPYIKSYEKTYISSLLGVSEHRIQRWWQNKRRKERRNLSTKAKRCSNHPSRRDEDSDERKSRKSVRSKLH